MQAGEQGNAGRRRRRRRRPSAAASSLEGRAERIVREIAALAAEVARHRGPRASGELDLSVKVALGDAQAAGGADLLRAIEAEVDRAAAVTAEYQAGRVYCFQCRDARCPHGVPQTPTQTFVGYTALGRPEWREFLEVCLERRPPRLDELYADPPAVLALVLAREELTGDLLPGFGRGSASYTILGQVVAGLVPQGRERVALTLQVVETRPGPERLRLNVLGVSPTDIAAAAADSAPRSPAERLRRTLEEARRRLAALERRAGVAEARREPWDMGQALEPFLARLRSDLERIWRPETHRTRHARERHAEAERPTGSALADARRAGDDRLLVDADQDTIVVLGPRGRTHVFSKRGRHVTSIHLEPGELARKIQKRRWRLLPPDQAAAFREALAHQRQ
jgi:hypothetical protein